MSTLHEEKSDIKTRAYIRKTKNKGTLVLYFEVFFFLFNILQIKEEPRHEISNNVVCVTSKASDQNALYAQSDQSLC